MCPMVQRASVMPATKSASVGFGVAGGNEFFSISKSVTMFTSELVHGKYMAHTMEGQVFCSGTICRLTVTSPSFAQRTEAGNRPGRVEAIRIQSPRILNGRDKCCSAEEAAALSQCRTQAGDQRANGFRPRLQSRPVDNQPAGDFRDHFCFHEPVRLQRRTGLHEIDDHA